MKKRGILISALTIVLLTSSIHATTDFSKDELKYQKMCRNRSSYRANKKTCESFEAYLKKQSDASDKAAANIKGKIKNTKNDIGEIVKLIKENNKLIDYKKKQIYNNEQNISETKKDIVKLEKDMLERLAMMQELTGENFVADFIMSSSSLEDFLIRMDGLSAINQSNNDVVKDLGYANKQLKVKSKKLSKDKVKLDESKDQQNVLLKDFRSNEADLYVKLEAERKKNTVYNDKLNGVDLDDPALSNDVPAETKPKPSKPKPPTTGGGTTKPPTTGGGTTKPPTTGGGTTKPPTTGGGTTKPPTTSTGWTKPVKHATVTATSWYYPQSFGGAWHPGVDLANKIGTPVIAPANGVVVAKGWDGYGYGNYMITAHQMGNHTYTFIFAHMNKPGWGTTLKRGQQIGVMGSTGNSTGSHTHVEVFKHSNKTLKKVVNTYKKNGDLYFGLGYKGIGSCGSVCRVKPHEFFGLRYGQVY